jgi:hypothetical protein
MKTLHRLPLIATLTSVLLAFAPIRASAQVAVAPSITMQPASQIVAAGSNATFVISAAGTPTPQFRWLKNGRDIANAETASFTINAAKTNDAAVYAVRVSNSAGSVTSAPAALAVNATAGTITFAPANVVAKAGTEAKFTVVTTGAGLTYQWQFNGRDISGAIAAALSVSNVGTTNGGFYSVTITNGNKPAATAAAALTVITDARLINIATRGRVGEGDAVLISGFVIRGNNTKKILLRAVGPTLGSQFNVAESLANPTLTLYGSSSGNAVLDTNSNWGGTTALSSVFAQVGAFPLVSTSPDAALLETLGGGAYSAVISAPPGVSGIALLEVYDADTGYPPAQIVNISTRAFVGAEAKDTLIAGFVISGTTSDTVLIRGVGPSLGTLFGLRNALGSSHVAVFDAKGNQIAANTVWGSARGQDGLEDASREDTDKEDDLDGASDRVGAWHLPRRSQDSAILLTLAPGAYTVHVTGVAGKSGIALAEIYEVR